MARFLPFPLGLCLLFLACSAVGAAPVLEGTAPPEGTGPEGVEAAPDGSGSVAPAEASPPAAPRTVTPTPPFTAVVVVNSANVRGGPSTNHFPLARLPKGTKVEVLERAFDWYRIAPPEGVFCWVHKDLVKLAPDGKSGMVTGRNVNIRGDSILGHPPLRSDVVDQVDEGTRVTVVGRSGDFLRIRPTPGAKVYVKADLLAPAAGGAVGAGSDTGSASAHPSARAATEVEPALAAFHKAEEALRAERLKSPAEWDLAKLAALYKEVLERASTERVKAAARSRLEYLDRLVLLKQTIEEVKRTRRETEEELKAIEERRKAEEADRAARRRAEAPHYTVTGILRPLVLGDGRIRFKLVDPDQPSNILCVVEGKRSALEPLLDRRVGIDGRFRVTGKWPVRVIEVSAIEPLEKTSAGETHIARPPAATVPEE